MPLDFTALDFETVASSGAAICSAGLTKVRNGVVIESKSWMVNPPIDEDSWNPVNMGINGLSAHDIKNVDRWPKVFDEIMEFADGDILAAHNAKSADMNFLRKNCAFFGLDYGTIRYVCTMNMGKILYPDLKSHKLGEMCRSLGVEFNEKDHHGAEYDARKCAELLIAMVHDNNAEDLESLEFERNREGIMRDQALQDYIKKAVETFPHGNVEEWLGIINPEPADPGDRCIMCGNELTSHARKNAKEMHCCTAKCVRKLIETTTVVNRRINNGGNFVETYYGL